MGGHRQAILGQAARDCLGADVAAIGEQHQWAAGGADAVQDLDGAGLGPAVTVGPPVHKRPVDVEHEPANVVEPQRAAGADLSWHGARAPFRRP